MPHANQIFNAARANHNQKLRPRTAAMPPIWISNASQPVKDTATMYQTKVVISPVLTISCHAIMLETMNATAVIIMIVVRILFLCPFLLIRAGGKFRLLDFGLFACSEIKLFDNLADCVNSTVIVVWIARRVAESFCCNLIHQLCARPIRIFSL